MRQRLFDVAAVVSLACDLAHGAQPERQLKAAALAARMASESGLSREERCNAFDAAILHWLGCTATAPTLSAWLGDEIAAHRRAAAFSEPLDPSLDVFRHAGAGASLLGRLAAIGRALSEGPSTAFAATCEANSRLAARLEYPPAVVDALGLAFERWDGRGWPGRLRGQAIPLCARIAVLADDAATLVETVGSDQAIGAIEGRKGRNYDPELVATFLQVVAAWLEECGSGDAWARAEAWDPAPEREVTGEAEDEALLVMADLVDIKTPITVGHSRGVAELARGAAGRLGLPQADAQLLWQAALVHDLGRVAVPNSVWNKPGPLTSSEWEDVRLHPYRLERFLTRSPWLSEFGALGATHHERLDGSGYHRGLSAGALTVVARVLATADVHQALREDRPHRHALSSESAGLTLREEVRAGRLDGEAVVVASHQKPLA